MENLTAQTFKEKVYDFTGSDRKLLGTKPVVIDFYADWCNPCKMVAPILEELSKEYTNVDFYKIDTDAESELAAIFNIRSIPFILFIPLEGIPQMMMGAQPKSRFSDALKNIFGIE
jgi:thioredoxin